jgi:sugar phosphate isomerase/epimerase
VESTHGNMHPRLSVSAVSSWRASFDDDLALWDRLGVSHVGLSLRKCEEVGLAVAVERIRSAGLRVSNIVECGWCELDDLGTWPAYQDRLLGALDAMRELAAPVLVLTTGPAGGLEWEAAAGALNRAINPVRIAAAEAGVRIAIENTSAMRLDLSFATTLRDTVDLAEQLGVDVCMELNSCWAERGFVISLLRARPRLAHVQISDAPVGSLTTPDRLVPGDGDIPLARRVIEILAADYRGAFEIEMVGPRIEAEGYESAIRRAIVAVDALLSEGVAGRLDG